MELKDIYTIVYYTGNANKPEFAQKIIDNLVKQAGDIPIISVSQKPMNLGKNICVGNVGRSHLNAHRQILVGVKEAKTPYVILAESDCLYPKEYFTLIPEEGVNLYCYGNVWVVWEKGGDYIKKKLPYEGAMIVRRDLMIKYYEESLKDVPGWGEGVEQENRLFRRQKRVYFGEIPAITFMTAESLSKRLNLFETQAPSLTYWGEITELRKKYL